MYTLYAYPNTYALGVHLMLEESGASYQLVDVSQNDTRISAEFLAASPHQRVPAMILENGQSLFESGAIALHLADTLCEGKFSMKQNSIHRPEFLQWLFYFSSTLQPDVMMQFHPEYYFSDDAAQQTLKQAAMQRLKVIWEILDNRYQIDSWMFENRPTAVDFALATVLRWPECFPGGIDDFPNLHRTLSAINKRPACRRVIRWHEGITR